MSKRPAVLSEIAEFTMARLQGQKRHVSPELLLEQARSARMPQSFSAAFRSPGLHVIAEIKRASPSEGPIAPNADPVSVAREYLGAGATALSVLTEPGFFRGDVGFLSAIRKQETDARLLMKDFVVDEYQLAQARAHGADAVLLIVAMLSEKELALFFEKAHDLGLETLVEVHDEAEMKTASRLGAKLIGVNNRNLKTMEVSLMTSERLADLAPKGAVLISESGLSRLEDLERLSKLGFHGFLIGTSFMKSGTPGRALSRLLGKSP
jgi:indole-3-glycerol phosphate synthase